MNMLLAPPDALSGQDVFTKPYIFIHGPWLMYGGPQNVPHCPPNESQCPPNESREEPQRGGRAPPRGLEDTQKYISLYAAYIYGN